MRLNLKIPLFIIMLSILILYPINTFAADDKYSGYFTNQTTKIFKNENTKVKGGGMSGTSHKDGSAVVLEVNINGIKQTLGTTTTDKVPGRPGLIVKEPPCYVYSYYGSGEIFALMSKMESERDNKKNSFSALSPDEFLAIDFTELTENQYARYEKLLEDGYTEEQIIKLLGLDEMTIQNRLQVYEDNDGKQTNLIDTITDIFGLEDALPEILKYNGTKDAETRNEAREALSERKLFVIEPNPDLLGTDAFAKPGDDPSTARCGAFNPGTAQLLITGIPAVPPQISENDSPGEYSTWLVELADSAGFSVDLEKVGEKTFEAKIRFDDSGTSIYGSSILPKEIVDVTFIWGLRAPDSSEPSSKTVKAGEAGIQTKSMSEVNDALEFTYKFEGESIIVTSGSMKSALSSAFSQYGGSLSNSKYIKTTDHLLQQQTIDVLNAITDEADFSNPMSALDIVQVTPHKDINRVFTVAEGASFVPQYDSLSDVLTDTFTIPSDLEGKYIVTVSAMVNGKYVIPETVEGHGFSFTYPLGFASDTALDLTSSCAELANAIRQYSGELVEDVEEEVKLLESEICQETKYKGPTAIADYRIVNNKGEVDLIASDSTGTYEYIYTYRFEAEKETVSCGEDCEEEIYTGNSDKIDVGPPEEKYYPIEDYIWSKKYRVFMPDGDGLRSKEYNYELDLSKTSEVSSASVVRAMMHKGDTFACVSVKTGAKSHNFAGGGPTPQAIKDRSGKAYLTHIFDSYDKSLYFDEFEKRQNCVFIDVENQDWRIIENTYDKQN